MPFQTEGEAWNAVRDTLTGSGIPKLQGATLGFSERVAWSTSESTVVVTRRFLSGPVRAREQLGELGLSGDGLRGLNEAQVWEAYQALSVGTLAWELARVSGRERKAELPPDEEAARAAAVERSALTMMAARAQIPATWLDLHQRLVCALAEAPGAEELAARARCEAASASPVPLEELAERFEPPPLDLFGAITAPDARGPGTTSAPVIDAPTRQPLRAFQEDYAVVVKPADERWSMEIQPSDRPEELRAVLVLPVGQTPATRGAVLDLVNAMNVAVGSEGVMVVLSSEGVLLWVSRWPLVSELGPLELTHRLALLAESTLESLPGVLAGTLSPDDAATRGRDALLQTPAEGP